MDIKVTIDTSYRELEILLELLKNHFLAIVKDYIFCKCGDLGIVDYRFSTEQNMLYALCVSLNNRQLFDEVRRQVEEWKEEKEKNYMRNN